MRADLYTKILLTLIAIALWGLLLQPYVHTESVIASTGTVEVNIKEIAGRRLVDSTIPVDIKKLNNQLLHNNVVPVEIKR